MNQSARHSVYPLPRSLGIHRPSWHRRLHRLTLEHPDQNPRKLHWRAGARSASDDRSDAAAGRRSMGRWTPIGWQTNPRTRAEEEWDTGFRMRADTVAILRRPTARRWDSLETPPSALTF